MPRLSNVAMCAIEHDLIYLAQILDALEYPSKFARMSFYDAQNAATPWMAHDLEWQVVSVCVWRDCPWGGRVYVALSWSGDVELLGPNERPNIRERILDRLTGPGTGLPPPTRLIGMSRIRAIGHRLYACGSGYHVFRRDGEGWEEITSAAMVAEGRDITESFTDLNGPDENNIYAVGSLESALHRISFFDGSGWRDLATNIKDGPVSITVAARGGVFITGQDGLLLHGDHRRGFAQYGANRIKGVLYDSAEFNGLLYIATQTGLFAVAGPDQPVQRVVTGLEPELRDTTEIDVVDGALWVFGRKDLAVFDGRTWMRVHDPENPIIGVDVFEYDGLEWVRGRGPGRGKPRKGR